MTYGFPCFSYLVDLLYFDIGLRTFSLTYMRTCEYNCANPFAYSESQISLFCKQFSVSKTAKHVLVRLTSVWLVVFKIKTSKTDCFDASQHGHWGVI